MARRSRICSSPGVVTGDSQLEAVLARRVGTLAVRGTGIDPTLSSILDEPSTTDSGATRTIPPPKAKNTGTNATPTSTAVFTPPSKGAPTTSTPVQEPTSAKRKTKLPTTGSPTLVSTPTTSAASSNLSPQLTQSSSSPPASASDVLFPSGGSIPATTISTSGSAPNSPVSTLSPDGSASSIPRPASIAGIVAGILFLVVLLIGGLFVVRRRRRKIRDVSHPEAQALPTLSVHGLTASANDSHSVLEKPLEPLRSPPARLRRDSDAASPRLGADATVGNRDSGHISLMPPPELIAEKGAHLHAHSELPSVPLSPSPSYSSRTSGLRPRPLPLPSASSPRGPDGTSVRAAPIPEATPSSRGSFETLPAYTRLGG
uniref:Uncharacterized protein n=1 Tax=Mycena chlorophos TaxID=658473 RepID=A0ABQ0LLV4_MYCCL|nr:predicted protein [Mycena chlorophos]